MIDIVLVLEWTKSSDLELTMEFMNTVYALASKNKFVRIGIILFGKEPIPLLDLGEPDVFSDTINVIRNIPLLQHPAEPSLAITEAVDMLEDLSEPISTRRIIFTVASFSSRPKIRLEDALLYLRSVGNLNHYLFTTSNRRPRWISNDVAREINILRKGAIAKYLRKII
ncbi:MAG: VWA domain-containing protein [Crenarchaeota archaeon]|nr:VWA domain-containing protein [Thermoproteota archaeon]